VFLKRTPHRYARGRRQSALALFLAISLIATIACAGGLNPSGGWAAPVVTDDGIIVGDKNGDLVLVNPDTNSVATLYPGDNLDLGKIYGTPLIIATTTYFASYDCKGNECEANVSGIDLGTRQSIWDRTKQYTPPGRDEGDRDDQLQEFNVETEIVGRTVLFGSTLIFGTSEIGGERDPGGFLIALDANPLPRDFTRVKWAFPTGDAVFSTPVVVDGIAYVTSLDKNIYAIDLADGIANVDDRLLWSFTAAGAIAATPVVLDGKLYVGDLRNNFYSLDIATRARAISGDEIDPSTEWIYDANGWVWAEAVIEGGIAFVANLGGEVHAVSLATGQEFWSESVKLEDQIVAAPVLYDGPPRPSSGLRDRLLAVPLGDADVWVIEIATGQELGKFVTGSGVKSSPVISESTIYIHTLDRELQWFSTNDRARQGCLKLNNGEDCR
jgi:outer membrane protein assembly factor BamB